MLDINKMTANEDILHYDPELRMADLPDWSDDIAAILATKEGIKLTGEHLEVLYLLRDHYRLHGHDMTGTKKLRALEEPFGARGGRKHLFQLFPEGPINQGSRLAGLPPPPYSKDNSFGSVE